LNDKLFLVLDIGTSDIKCGCVNVTGTILARHQREFPMTQRQDVFEIDFDLFFDSVGDLLKGCLAQAVVQRAGVEALLITSQAQTFAPVDADFRPLRPGIVWLDERAREEAEILQQHVPDFAEAAGFARPLPAQYVSKLLWLKRREPEVFKKARAFPLIHEYLAYRLTGHFYSDSTSFGMGGVYDFRRKDLNPEILAILGLTPNAFPKIERAATRGERISNKIQQDWAWPERFPVFLCGNDQGASACGAGLHQPGDVNINLGTAMVFYTITNSLATRLTESQIAGKHPVGESYFLLNYEPDFGLKMRELKEYFFSQGTYDNLFQTYFEYPEVDARAPSFKKSEWHAFSGMQAHRFCAGIIKHYMIRLKSHLSRIREAVPVKNMYLSGGMLQSEVLIKIVQEALQRPLTIQNRADAGLFGAVEIYSQNKIGGNKNE